jgi:uncharacterized protein (DUF1330 family)
VPIQPTPDQIRALRDSELDTPVVMLNLLKFRDRTEGDDDSGRASYAKYGDGIRSMLEATGARVLWQGRGDSVVIGDDADDWDAVILVEYPSRSKFLEMVSRPDYQEQSGHRTSALVDSRLVACTEVFRSL